MSLEKISSASKCKIIPPVKINKTREKEKWRRKEVKYGAAQEADINLRFSLRQIKIKSMHKFPEQSSSSNL